MKQKRNVCTTEGYFEAREEFIKEKKLLAREICIQKTIQRVKKSRQPKTKVGAKEILTDDKAIYLRRESKTKSVTSLCKELNISRRTADNCIKGITYKHLDAIEKPQL